MPSETGTAEHDGPAAAGETAVSDPATPPENGPIAPAYVPTVDDSYGYYDDPYGYDSSGGSHPGHADPVASTLAAEPVAALPAPSGGGSGGGTTEAVPEEEDKDDDGMLRMSFMEHLEELRSRLIKALMGVGIAFAVSLKFSDELWTVIQQPASAALRNVGFPDARLVFTSPMEVFNIIWLKMPMLTAIFLASPWLLYQVWGFVSPGLYKRERRLAAPFILSAAGLFILGGLFGYFVAFRLGLTFLLGIGVANQTVPMVTVEHYFDLFVNVILGVAVVFELPVLVFFLTLLRITTARFLVRNSRYAILGIVLLAAFITPTPDVFNLMIFSVPMILLFFVGIFASYLLELSRENRRFPWRLVAMVVLLPLALLAAAAYFAVSRYGYHWTGAWPFLAR